VTPVAVKLHHCDVDAGVLAINRDDLTRTERYNELKLVLQAALREEGDSFDDLCSSHDLALTWLADYDGVDVDPRETARIHQRFATAQFYFSTQIPIIDVTPSTKLTPFNWLLDDVSECQWSGVTCNSQSAITAIQVEHTGLRGTIPNELAFLLPSLSKCIQSLWQVVVLFHCFICSFELTLFLIYFCYHFVRLSSYN
jgi:hypothetical protein